MGHGVSCARTGDEHDYFRAAQVGDLEALEALLDADPSLARRATLYDRLSALHIAAANGRLEVLSMVLDHGVPPDVVNRHKQTPLMLAAMHGKTDCVLKLLQAGANILMFDSQHGRTCLHHASYFGHVGCLQAILTAARTTPVANSWFPGSTSLHLAARSGSLDCTRKLLAWGADRLRRDSAGRIPYAVALKRNHEACAALLNPSAAEPMVWPSPFKFISELEPEAKALLEAALTEANREREEKILRGTKHSPHPPTWDHASDAADADAIDDASSDASASDAELCCICFDQACTMEVQDCGHQMCAPCTLALCCHSKPDPVTLALPSPACPFCRGSISRLLLVARASSDDADTEKSAAAAAAAAASSPQLVRRRSRRSHNLSDGGSSSFKGLSSAVAGSFSKIGRGSSRTMADSDGCGVDKPEHDP
uniref:RING-type E3 ubiquitin transferase n=1 Tax=Zea mays TaxID=4577 RepID=A0A804PRL8_MAIZE